jgi:hypothetical protein
VQPRPAPRIRFTDHGRQGAWRDEQSRSAGTRLRAASIAAVLVAMTMAGHAQPTGIDPLATQRLRKWTDFCARQNRFSAQTRISFEVVFAPGQKLDLVAPAGELVYPNAYDSLMTDVTSGFVDGKSMVEGARCDPLAFRAPQVDGQIRIREGGQPLPMKPVITIRNVVNAPQFLITVTKWGLQPKVDDPKFDFTPPRDAKKVEFLTR